MNTRTVDETRTHTPTPSWAERLSAQDPTLRVHLLGIGGTGLHPIATILHQMGIRVSGSDLQANPRTQDLARQGVTVLIGQEAENFARLEALPHVTLISSAVSPHNPERREAERLGLPVVKRRDFLAPLLAQRRVIGVAGSHGKSTTSAMIVSALRACGVDAGYILGSPLADHGNAHAGSHPLFVIEADEYDGMFLGLHPSLAVITNIEWDHPDCYPTPQSFAQAFAQFAAQTRPDGHIIACGDDAGALALYRQAHANGSGPGPAWLLYTAGPPLPQAARQVWVADPLAGEEGGFGGQAHCRGSAQTSQGQPTDTPLGRLALRAPGMHNLRNALAALSVAAVEGLPLAPTLAGLHSYRGVERRFEVKGMVNGVTVIDDYAHHPTEVRATLAAARARYPGHTLWAVFQPHTFSRTAAMLPQMAASFDDADRVIVTDIYPAREQDTGLVHSRDLVAASSHPAIQHIPGLEDAAQYLGHNARPGDVVVILGAGSSHRVGEILLETGDWGLETGD